MIKPLFKYIWKNKVQMAKFAVVGATSAIIDFGLLYVLTDFVNWHYLLSATVSFIIAAIYNFILNRSWTFRSNGKKRKQIPIFFAIVGSGVLLNNFIMWFGVEQTGLWYIYAKVIAAAIVTIWNFMGNKYLTFRKIEEKPDPEPESESNPDIND